MSFKEEYKSAMNSVSPDTDKIMAGVYEKLNEKEVPKKQNKALFFAVASSFAATAACLALCAVVLFNIVPNFNKMNGDMVTEDANGMQAPNFAESNFSGGIADDKVPEGIESNLDVEQTKPAGTESDKQDVLVSIEFIGGDLATAQEVILNGIRYKNIEDTVSFSEKPEKILLLKTSDGELFSVYLVDNKAYICKGEWQTPQMTYCFDKQ